MNTIKYLIAIFLAFLSCEKSLDPSKNSQWYLQHSFKDGITYYAIEFSDSKNGWAVGYSGTIQKTSNGGESWTIQKSGVSSNLWDISFVDHNTGWICGANNTILKTVNGGKSWQKLSTDAIREKIITSIKFIDSQNGWASSNAGEILKSMDGGETWKITKIFPLGGGSELAVLDTSTVYCQHGDLVRTFDGGETWDSQNMIDSKKYGYRDIIFVDESRGFVPTINGTGGAIITEFPVLSTTDGGMTWQLSEPLKDDGLYCIFFVDENYGWVAGSENIYSTIDCGQTWNLEFASQENHLGAKDMHFVNRECGWIINYEGDVYRYTGSYKK